MTRPTSAEYREKWLAGQREAAPQQPEGWYQRMADDATAHALRIGIAHDHDYVPQISGEEEETEACEGCEDVRLTTKK